MIMLVLCSLSGFAIRYLHDFKSVPVAQALDEFIKAHPEAQVVFVYNDLDLYKTTATISSDNLLDAIRQLVGRNPIYVREKNNRIFVEAMQKGKYTFRGRLVDNLNEGVAYASVFLLAPKDSTVITFGIADSDGRFSIPCDRKNVIAKMRSSGHNTLILNSPSQEMGNVRMSIRAVSLDGVTVVGNNAMLMADRTVYVPEQRQRNTAIDGLDLLERMAIPQLVMNPRTGIPETASGKPVDIFIDSQPATQQDLKAMNLQDVKRVEYLDFPSDSRFLGKQHVVNFIMAKYEYGGYVRPMVYENFVLNSGSAVVSSRFQYKKMTYDLVGMGFYFDNDKERMQENEVYRLPQPDGSEETIDRNSGTTSADNRRQQYGLTFKAAYSSDKFNAHNTVSGTLDNHPDDDLFGFVNYSHQSFPDSKYSSRKWERAKAISYFGSFFWLFPGGRSLSFTPRYTYSRTMSRSAYFEEDMKDYVNGAHDNTTNLAGRLSYNMNFGKYGSLSAFADANYNYYRTRYNGTASMLDHSRNANVSAGVDYSVNIGGFYGQMRFGWAWDYNKVNDVSGNENTPSVSLSLQYMLKKHHRLSGSVEYSLWAPSPSFKSRSVIEANHLMSYTGNPDLVASKSVSVGLSYLWIPSSIFNLSVFGSFWSVGHRYVYDYEATDRGVLRTIKQPMGSYRTWDTGMNASVRLFDRNLQLSGNVNLYAAHNGVPYDYTRTNVFYGMSATYFIGNAYITARYSGPSEWSDGFMVGKWIKAKDSYRVNIGWANNKWNLRLTAMNFARWNKYSTTGITQSRYYDNTYRKIDVSQNAFFTLSATYTFSYGKKVRSNDEPGQAQTSSGILKN